MVDQEKDSFDILIDEIKGDAKTRIQFTKELFGPVLSFLADISIQHSLALSRTFFLASAGATVACLAYLATNVGAEDALSLAIKEAFGWCILSTLAQLVVSVVLSSFLGGILRDTFLLSVEVIRLKDRDNFQALKTSLIKSGRRIQILNFISYGGFGLLLYAAYVLWAVL